MKRPIPWSSETTSQQADVAHAEESLTTLEEKRGLLEEEIETDLERIRLESGSDSIALEPIDIPAKKTDITVEEVVLAWVPAPTGPMRAERGAWG